MRLVSRPEVGFDEGITITLRLPITAREEIRPILDVIENFSPEEDYVLSLSKAKKPRSMNANSYMWVLCDKIADVTRTTKEEVYRKAIREVGVFNDVAVQEGEACQMLVKSWGGNGIGYFAEVFNSLLHDKEGRPMKRVRLYEGSHKYNSKEMSRCIDYIIDEAKNLGIETMTPNQIEELKNTWKG